jgi:hypothetical protein
MRRGLGIAASDACVRFMPDERQHRSCAEQRLLPAAPVGRPHDGADALPLEVSGQVRSNSAMLAAVGDQHIIVHRHRKPPPPRRPLRRSPCVRGECHSLVKSKAEAGRCAAARAADAGDELFLTARR